MLFSYWIRLHLSTKNVPIPRDGETAPLMYLKALKNQVPIEEKDRIYANLRKYCSLDTLRR
jgi:hypothetical protein